ncbi:uncharacterized protein [Palaemon carinicauda]|uniref:uncharacterized protein n=1 Tax=Palaemon carinicauda TaxID=392227 RepID=UPI0035B66440
MPLTIVTSCNNVDKADRCPVPSSLDLGVWGTFPVIDYTPEPLRCYNCQCYGHHKEDCQGPATCGVCSQRHNTEIRIQAHKNGKETRPKCRNCSRPHHAWNKRCPERLRRIAAMKGTSTPKTNTPALMSQPKDQRTPRQRTQCQPTTVPAPAIAKQRKSTIIPAPATKLQAVSKPPAPATKLEAVSTPHRATPTPQPTSLAQQIE